MMMGPQTLIGTIFLLSLSSAGPVWGAGADVDFGKLDSYISRQMQQVGVPGVTVAVVRVGQASDLKAYGSAGPGVAASVQAPFDLASVTKSFTALAVMQLVEQDKIDLDKPVRTYLPWFSVADETVATRITVRHLLTHTSGLSTLSGRKQLLSRDVGPAALEAAVRELAGERPTAKPGERFQYSNANYAAAAVVVAAVSGIPFDRYVEDRIFAPLGMRNSFTSEVAAASHGLATGHRQWFGYPVAAPGLPYTHADLGAGGLFASAEDLARYLTALLNGGELDGKRILSADGVEELFRPAVEIRPDLHYALGWFVRKRHGKRIVYHGGDNPHFHADLVLAPDEGVGVAVLMNANSPASARRLSLTSHNVMALVRGKDLLDTPRDPVITGLLITPPVLLLFQALVAVRGVRKIRRWRLQPETRPRSWKRWFGVGFSLASNLALAAVLLVGVPLLFEIPLSALFVLAPDYAWPAALSGSLAIGWAAMRTVLTLRSCRRQTETAI